MVMSSFQHRVINWFRRRKTYIVNIEIRQGKSYAIHTSISVEANYKEEAYQLAAEKVRKELTITCVGLKSLGKQ